MAKTHKRHQGRYARQAVQVRARDMLERQPRGNVAPSTVDIFIGRYANPQSTYGNSDGAAEQKLTDYVIGIESKPENDDLGHIIDPSDLVLRVVSARQFNERYDMFAAHRGYSNRGLAGRRKNMINIKKEVQQALQEQETMDPIGIVDPFHHVSRNRSLALSEPGAELVYFDDDYNDSSEPSKTYPTRGGASLKFHRNLRTTHDPDSIMESIVPNSSNHAGNLEILGDDVYRINDAFRSVGFVAAGMPRMELRDMSLELPVFVYSDRHKAAESGLVTPHAPIGLIALQPLGIHKID